MDVISKTVDLVNELQELAIENDLSIVVDMFGRKGVCFLGGEKFFEFFKEYDVETRTSRQFPYEAFTEIDGIRFYVFLTKEDYKKYVLKTA